MVYDIIITGSVVFTGKEILRDGYVYIKGGRVIDVGEGPVPDDYTYATLVLGGPNRVVTPGLAVAADVATYNYRLRRPHVRERERIQRSSTIESLVLASLFGVYELHLSGVTTIMIESVYSDIAQRLEEVAGGFYGVAIPSCWNVKPPREVVSIKVDLEGCGDGGVDGNSIIYLENRVSYSPIGLSQIWEKNMELRRRAGLAGGLIREGERAEVAVYDARKPPLAFVETNPEAAKAAPVVGAKVESLIAGDEVLVDGGQHLNITIKHLADALSKLRV